MCTPIQGRGATAPRPNSKHAASSALTLLARLVMCDFIAMRAVCADSPPVDLAIVALVVTSGAGHFAQLLARWLATPSCGPSTSARRGSGSSTTCSGSSTASPARVQPDFPPLERQLSRGKGDLRRTLTTSRPASAVGTSRWSLEPPGRRACPHLHRRRPSRSSPPTTSNRPTAQAHSKAHAPPTRPPC